MNPPNDRLTTADLASAPPRTDPRDPRTARQPQNPRPVDGRRTDDEDRAAVFLPDEVNKLRPQWDAIQTKFIDEPRKSVEEADALVASTIQRLAESFANQRTGLEAQWAKGDNVSTEDLRQALRRYRSFFDRLLTA